MPGDDTTTDVARRGAAVDATTADGRYVLGDPIGHGGMGTVYAARDLQLGRDVAIKRLRADSVTDQTLERFMREATIQGRLDHPAVVPVHELRVDAAGVPYFVMRKLTGTTLATLVGAPVAERPRLLRAFVDVCLAMEYAHTRGFVHRDLKPENIVVGDFGEVYVLDWGVAREGGDGGGDGGGDSALTAVGHVVGTPGYLAPEQARGLRDVDGRADVYALGCILFELLAGQRLHPSGSPGIASVLAGIDARPSVRAPDRDVAPELDAICLQATATDREIRIASARALSVLVQSYLDGDRDVAMRSRLARDQLAAGVAALGEGDSDAARSTAMRCAGRALALDPTLSGAAELVGRLMLEPPAALPDEVRASLAHHDHMVARRTARSGMWAVLAFLVMLPALLVAGFRDAIYPVALTAMVGSTAAVLWWYSRSAVRLPDALPIIATTLLVALMARMFSPFLVAPGIAAVAGMALMFGLASPTVRGATLLITVMTSAVVVPWLAEVLGIVSTTIVRTPSSINLTAPALQNETTTSVFLLVGYTLVLVAAAVVMTAEVRRAELMTRRHLHLQAWHLAQLVPTPPA